MEHRKFCTAGCTTALKCAASALWSMGWEYDASAKNLLLPVPSFDPEGRIIGGGRIEDILTEDTTVIGGNLQHKALTGHRCIDLLQDAQYLAQNASITAYCALRYAENKLSVILRDCPVLVIGWGRIGKCLADLLHRMGANVHVHARKEQDRAVLQALGYSAVDRLDNKALLKDFYVIYNTVPHPVLRDDLLTKGTVLIDLASVAGIAGEDVIWARGLPNKDAPESSGLLIAKTVDRLGKEFML